MTLHQSFTGVFLQALLQVLCSVFCMVLSRSASSAFLRALCSVLFLKQRVIWICVLMHSLYNFLTVALAFQIPCVFWTVILHLTCLVMLPSAYYVRYVSDRSCGALSCPNLRQKCVNDNCEGFVLKRLKR